MKNEKEVGDRLREARESRHMTQGELAAKLGVHIATVTLWENRKNRRQIGMKHIGKVAEVLGMRVSELLGETEPAPASDALVTTDLVERQLLKMFRLMPEKMQMLQLAQFVECVSGGGGTDTTRHQFSPKPVPTDARSNSDIP